MVIEAPAFAPSVGVRVHGRAIRIDKAVTAPDPQTAHSGPNRFRKSSTISFRPSRNGTFGSHPSISRARAMSGLRCCGSQRGARFVTQMPTRSLHRLRYAFIPQPHPYPLSRLSPYPPTPT